MGESYKAFNMSAQVKDEIADITMTSTEADSSQTHGHEGK